MKYWDETLAVSQRILTELIKRRRSLIFWSIFPISILFINGYILGERANLELSVALKMAAPPSLVGAALFFSCLGGSVATVVSEREQKTLKRLFISPLSGFSYFLGIFLAHALIGVGQTFLVYGVIFLRGETIEGSFFLGLAILFLSIAGYVGVGFILGTQLAKRTEDVNAIVATFGVPLLIIGGTFLPTSLFPDGLLRVAQFNPIFHMNEALIDVWAGGSNFEDVQNHFWFLFIFSGVMVISGWFSYYRMVQSEKAL
ncbi:ABC2-type transport system permease component [Cyanobacterium sp. HL-69]|uniref:ABC transporter permease n=1 Tax=Cyanobacterium sp. HL-69 TaxID=2054282 RepID=UPI000CA27CD1|nr:ABC2-type transport system permease component [Cyanobacterium sp. HL-69]